MCESLFFISNIGIQSNNVGRQQLVFLKLVSSAKIDKYKMNTHSFIDLFLKYVEVAYPVDVEVIINSSFEPIKWKCKETVSSQTNKLNDFVH